MVSTKQKIDRLLKREYLRGYINATNKGYTVESLKKEYKKYIKDNPSVKKDKGVLAKCLENGNRVQNKK